MFKKIFLNQFIGAFLELAVNATWKRKIRDRNLRVIT